MPITPVCLSVWERGPEADAEAVTTGLATPVALLTAGLAALQMPVQPAAAAAETRRGRDGRS